MNERIERGDIGQANAETTKQFQNRVKDVSEELLNCLHEVRLGDDLITIKLDRGLLAGELKIDPNAISPETRTFQRPFTQLRRGVEKRLIIETAAQSRNEILVRNVARAEQLRTAILKVEIRAVQDSGRHPSIGRKVDGRLVDGWVGMSLA